MICYGMLMKTEIQKVKYNKKAKSADWWAWKETCDNCGQVIKEVNTFITLSPPLILKK